MSVAVRYRRFWLGLGFAMLAFIIVLSVWPLPEQPAGLPYSDKIIHALVFGFLMVWFAGLVEPGRYIRVFAWLTGYGVAMELIQSFAPYRFMSLGDLLADVIGLAAGWAAATAGAAGWCAWVEARLP